MQNIDTNASILHIKENNSFASLFFQIPGLSYDLCLLKRLYSYGRPIEGSIEGLPNHQKSKPYYGKKYCNMNKNLKNTFPEISYNLNFLLPSLNSPLKLFFLASTCYQKPNQLK